MGMCVSMSGKGCRYFEHHSKLAEQDQFAYCQGLPNPAFSALFELVHLNPDIVCTRLDIACDDYVGLLDISRIGYMIDEDLVRSRTKRSVAMIERNGKQRAGQTYYVGSRNSENFVRFYDKAKEEFKPGQPGYDAHHVRCEIVLKGEHANNFVDLFVNSDNLGDLVAQVLNDKLAFINRDDTNISRCSVCDWWLEFVDTLAAVHLVQRGKEPRSLDEDSQWFEHQVAPKLAMMCEVYENDAEFIRYMLESGRRRWNKVHKARIEHDRGLRFDRKLPYIAPVGANCNKTGYFAELGGGAVQYT